MKDLIQNIDNWFLLLINSHHNHFMDRVMWFASGMSNWFPLYLVIMIFIALAYKKESILLILLIVPLILLSDQISSSIIKPLVHRLRPSHEPGLENILHYVNHYRGGLYGFVSSHSANFFAVGTYLVMTASKRLRWLPLIIVPVTGLVIYSRMYLGVHYPTDILCGAILGILLGRMMAAIYNRLTRKTEPVED